MFCFVRFFQKGEVNLENVSHEDAVATLKTTQDRVVLVVAKPDSAFTAPSEPSYSPKLCKLFIEYIFNSNLHFNLAH